ncbi:MAG: hypothetical protein VKJ66_01595 [Synechococcus sp.]|nr:hypothetical protein [Synechococcus sp.]
MAIVNRCALAVTPREPLRAWARSVEGGGQEAEWPADDPSLYLLPDYENDDEARELLEQCWEVIFETELDSWCRDEARWPQQRSLELFEEWFELRFYPLIEDLVEEPLEREEADEEFIGAMRDVMDQINRPKPSQP